MERALQISAISSVVWVLACGAPAPTPSTPLAVAALPDPAGRASDPDADTGPAPDPAGAPDARPAPDPAGAPDARPTADPAAAPDARPDPDSVAEPGRTPEPGSHLDPAADPAAHPDAAARPPPAEPPTPEWSEDLPWLHIPDDPRFRARLLRRHGARFRRPRVPPGYEGDPGWVRMEAGRVLDALSAVPVGMSRAAVLRLLGPPDDRDRRSDYFDYSLSPVASFMVEFEGDRVINSGYTADSDPSSFEPTD